MNSVNIEFHYCFIIDKLFKNDTLRLIEGDLLSFKLFYEKNLVSYYE